MSLRLARPGGLTPERTDALITLALLIELELEAWLDTVLPPHHRLPASIAVVFLATPVMVRRRWPAASVVACGLVAGVTQAPPSGNLLDGMTGTILPPILLAFTAGQQLKRRRGAAATVVATGLIAGGAIWSTAGPPTGFSLGSELAAAVTLPLIFWALGWLWQERARRTSALRGLVATIERERDSYEQIAAARERIKISQELQDIIAQNVSAIIIQAGGARQLIDTDPERAVAAIRTVEHIGRAALADLRRTLGLLRTGGDPGELAPRPGLEQLDSLRDLAREQGLDCTLRTEGEPRELATGINLLAYRVIEAALLTADHDHRLIEVVGRYEPSGLTIEITGRGPSVGLANMLRSVGERAALYDGRLTIEPLSGGGFAITAYLPQGVPN